MIKRAITLVAATALAVGAMAGTASAEDHGGDPDHGHVLLLGVDLDTFEFRKCVDLAGGNTGVRGHHPNIHTGKAGEALRGKAGHLVIPLNGFGGGGLASLENCAELEAALGR